MKLQVTSCSLQAQVLILGLVMSKQAIQGILHRKAA